MRLCKEVLSGGSPCPEEKRKQSPDPRNFIAHAGLEENITCIKRVGSEVYLWHRRLDAENLMNVLKAGFKRLQEFLKHPPHSTTQNTATQHSSSQHNPSF